MNSVLLHFSSSLIAHNSGVSNSFQINFARLMRGGSDRERWDSGKKGAENLWKAREDEVKRGIPKAS